MSIKLKNVFILIKNKKAPLRIKVLFVIKKMIQGYEKILLNIGLSSL